MRPSNWTFIPSPRGRKILTLSPSATSPLESTKQPSKETSLSVPGWRPEAASHSTGMSSGYRFVLRRSSPLRLSCIVGWRASASLSEVPIERNSHKNEHDPGHGLLRRVHDRAVDQPCGDQQKDHRHDRVSPGPIRPLEMREFTPVNEYRPRDQ